VKTSTPKTSVFAPIAVGTLVDAIKSNMIMKRVDFLPMKRDASRFPAHAVGSIANAWTRRHSMTMFVKAPILKTSVRFPSAFGTVIDVLKV
jgi:hypothetical protein